MSFVDFLRDEVPANWQNPMMHAAGQLNKKQYAVIGFKQDILMRTFFLSIAYPKRKYAFRIN